MTYKQFWMLLIGVILAALILPFLYRPPGLGQAGPGLPWQVEALADGSTKVFGLTLGKSTLADAAAVFGDRPKIAIVATRGQPANLEAFFDTLNIGPVTAKLVLNASLPAETVQAMQERAAKEVPLATGAHRFDLIQADHQAASKAPIASVLLLPQGRLDEAAIQNRFGHPAERLKDGEGTEHFLYPERGVDVAMSEKGKLVIQYVLPARFAQLREPLLAKKPVPAQ